MKLHLPTRGLLVLLMMCFACTQLWAQSRKVTGTVTDNETKKPLTGVTVGVKGSTRNVVTDADGKFEISVPSDQTVLKFTYVGFTYTEFVVGKKVDFDVSLLKDNGKLDDVVVIGYGTQKARNTTAAIVSVDTKKMEDLPVASLAEMLRGQVPGLNVTGGSTRPGTLAAVNIRQQFYFGKDGGTTLPLVIIDDVEQIDPSTGLSTLNTFNLLDLSEVESITVLKDASAAIYGPRGSQGAIIVKTKKGKPGAPRISYSGKVETNNAVSFGKVMNAQQYGIFNNRFYDALTPTTPNNFFSPAEIDSMANINYNWLSSWKAAGNMQHALNVSGGSDRASYFVGGSYYTQGANLGSQDFNRWTYRAGADVKVATGLKLSAVVSGNSSSNVESFTKINITDAYANGGGEQADYAILLHMPKYIPWQYNINGTTQYVSPVLKPGTLGSATGNNSLSNWNYYALLNNGSQTNPTTFSYNANFQLQYDIPFIKGLSVKGAYSVGSTAGSTEQDFFAETLVQATNANVVGTHLFNSGTVWGNPVTNASNSRVTYGNNTSTIQQENFYLNYDRSFGDHNVSAVFVGEQSKYTYNATLMLYNSPVPGGYVGSGSTAGTLDIANSSATKSSSGTQSYLGRVSYNYKNKYLAQFLFRTDASNKLAPQNYWGVFPSGSIGWVISEENFFKDNVRWVNNLKLRFSLGQTGSDNIKAFKWEQLYTPATNTGQGFGSNGGLLTNGLTPGVSPNPDVDWDKTLQRDLGLDMTLLKNRLTVTLDGYYNSTRNMITVMTGATNVPISLGGSFAEQNFAGVDWWGAEVNINWHDHIGKVDYTIGLNTSLNNNENVKYLTIPFNYPAAYAGVTRQGQSSIQPTWGYATWKGTSGGDGLLRTDADVTNYWNYLTDLATKAGTTPLYNAGGANISSVSGMRKGMLAYQDVAGNLNTGTQTVAGQNGQINDQQDWVKLAKSGQSYGFTTNIGASFQGVSFLAQISTSWGGYRSIDRVSQSTSSTAANWSQVAYLNDMYDTANNVKGKYPNIAYYSSAYVASDFWSLPTFRCFVRSMSVGYTLPKRWMDRVHIANAKLVLSGYNLWDFYNPYPDKFRNMYDAANINYPTLRTWALGVNLGF